MTIYVVVREGPDGTEHNLFTDESLAAKWSQACDGVLYADTIWDETFTNEMIGEEL